MSSAQQGRHSLTPPFFLFLKSLYSPATTEGSIVVHASATREGSIIVHATPEGLIVVHANSSNSSDIAQPVAEARESKD